jgi:hypothetical protein
VSINRVRTIVLGVLAMLTVGSFAAASASAEPGPFWYHRSGCCTTPMKIEQPKDEQFQGKGGRQILEATIGGREVEIESPLVQIKGRIYNNALQGQIKVTIIYHNPTLLKPVLKPCEVKVGTNNEVQAFGHLAWKYQGNTSELTEQPQLKQKPDIIFTPKEIEEGAKELPKGEFTKITFTGSGCGVLTGSSTVKGSVSALINPPELEIWSTQLKVSTPGWTRQHFWNGKEAIEVEPKLIVGELGAKLVGEFEAHADEQEIAIYRN